MHRIALGVALIVLAVAAQEDPPLVRSGDITKDETWSGTVHVTGPTFVREGATLTIEPGTVVRLRHGNSYEGYLSKNRRAVLKITEGRLKAIGTKEKPIRFTSDREKPINGDWEGIQFVWSTQNELRYVIVEYAEIAVELEQHSSATVSHSILRWSDTGLYQEVHCSLVAEYNTFYGLGHEPIAMEEYCNGVFRHNRITGSNSGIVVCDGTAEVLGNEITGNRGHGMEIIGAWGDCDVVFKGNIITGNGGTILGCSKGARVECVGNVMSGNEGGIECWDVESLVFTGNAYFDNEGKIEIGETEEADLTGNWWGTTDPKKIGAMMDGEGEIEFEPVLEWNSVRVSRPELDYADPRETELGYIPGDPEDRYVRIFPAEDATRKVVRRIGAHFGYVGVGWSLCWDGEALWTFRHDSAQLCRVDPGDGKVLKEFKVEGINRSRGLAFDGAHLWVNDFAEMKVLEVDPENGEVLSSFPVPREIEMAQTILWNGKDLFLSGYGEPKLYKVSKKGKVLGATPLERGGTVAVAWDGTHWWNAAEDGAIYRMDADGKLVGMINGAAKEPWAMAWDGSHLWTIQRLHERWEKVPRMFRIEILDDQAALKRLREDE
ncbi:MAG: right-handed parallel beta-helix repeat-containing protein [Planctomycetota bacterium]